MKFHPNRTMGIWSNLGETFSGGEFHKGRGEILKKNEKPYKFPSKNESMYEFSSKSDNGKGFKNRGKFRELK